MPRRRKAFCFFLRLTKGGREHACCSNTRIIIVVYFYIMIMMKKEKKKSVLGEDIYRIVEERGGRPHIIYILFIYYEYTRTNIYNTICNIYYVCMYREK